MKLHVTLAISALISMKTNYYYKINYFTQYIDRDVYKTYIKIQDMKVVNTETT